MVYVVTLVIVFLAGLVLGGMFTSWALLLAAVAQLPKAPAQQQPPARTARDLGQL